MRRVRLVGLAVCVWLAASLPAQAVVLRYSPRVGSVTKHKMTMAGRMETTTDVLPEPMRMEITGSLAYTEKVLSETADTARVETTTTGGRVTLKMAGESQSQDMPRTRMVADMDRRGRVVKLVEADVGGEKVASSVLGAGPETLSFSNFGTFPEGDVNVGDVWSDEVRVPATKETPEIRLKVNSRLLELATVGGRNCAKIRTNFRGPITVTLGEEEGGGTVNASLEGDVIWFYDHENSLYVSGEGTVGMDMRMSVAAPGMPGVEMTSKMLMNMKIALAE